MHEKLIPSNIRLRVIPDVHGESDYLDALIDEARSDKRFVIQLGDLVDRGPCSARALAHMLDVVDAGCGVMLRANHEYKIVRKLKGREVTLNPMQEQTLREIDASAGLANRFIEAWETAPLYARWNNWLFVHGSWHPSMTAVMPPSKRTARSMEFRAMYGQTTGRRSPEGHPERVWEWVEELPPDLKVIVGHDSRSSELVLCRTGARGGAVYLLDLGCGKGGPLAYCDLDSDDSVRFSHPVALWPTKDEGL